MDRMMVPPGNGDDDIEYAKIQGAIESASKRIAAYEDQIGPKIRPYRYVVNMAYEGNIDNDDFPSQVRIASVQIKEGTIFYAKRLECVYSVVGTLASNSQAITLTVPASVRIPIFRFLWSVRDTGSDREWQNSPLPDSLLFTGNTNGFVLKGGHFLLSGGSELVIAVNASINTGGLPFTNVPLTAISSHQLQFSFAGVEVRRD